MIKIQFEIVDFEVSKIYDRNLYASTDLHKNMFLVEDMITSCGWGLEEFIDEGWNRTYSQMMAN